MRLALKRSFAFLLLALVAFSSTPARAQEQVPGLDALLAEIPRAAYDGWLTYADLDALLAGYGAALPADTEAYFALDGTAGKVAVMSALLAVSAGQSSFFQSLYKPREALTSSGFDVFSVHHVLEIGSPPTLQDWLTGTFPQESIRGKLAEKGYVQVNTGINGRETWASGGDLASGGKMDLASRDPYFLFGGSLGQKWPVVQMPGILATTRDEAGIHAIGWREGPFLDEDKAITGTLAALRGMGSLAQLYLFTPGKAGLDTGAQDALPRYSLIGIAHAFTPDAQRVVIGLSYEDGETARATADLLAARLVTDIPASSGGTLQALIADHGGAMEPLLTVVAPGGGHVALLSFRFPLPAPQSEKDPYPFRLFVNMLFRRDLGWLGTAGE